MHNTMTKSILLNGILLLSTTNTFFGMEDKPLTLMLCKFSEKDAQYHPIEENGTITFKDPIYVNEDFTKADLTANCKITINKQYTASIIEKDGQYFVKKRAQINPQISSVTYYNKDIQSALTTITKEQADSLFAPTHSSRQNDKQKQPFAIALAGNDLYHIKRKLKNEIIATTTESSTLENGETKEIQPPVETKNNDDTKEIQPPVETNNNNGAIETTTETTESKNDKIDSAPSSVKIYVRNSTNKKLYLIKKDGKLEESEATFDDNTCTKYNAVIEKDNDQSILKIWNQNELDETVTGVYPTEAQIDVINRTFEKGGSIFKIGKTGHSRIYRYKQPEDKSTIDSQKSMDFFVQYNSKINSLIYLITPEGDLVATKKQLPNSTYYEAVEGVRQFDDLKETHNMVMTLQPDKSQVILEQIKTDANEITISPETMPLSEKQLEKITELRKAGHKIYGIDAEYGTQFQFHPKPQPRSNSMYYIAGTFGVGIAGLIAAYFYFPELFKNISLPNFLKNIDFSALKKLVSRGN